MRNDGVFLVVGDGDGGGSVGVFAFGMGGQRKQGLTNKHKCDTIKDWAQFFHKNDYTIKYGKRKKT